MAWVYLPFPARAERTNSKVKSRHRARYPRTRSKGFKVCLSRELHDRRTAWPVGAHRVWRCGPEKCIHSFRKMPSNRLSQLSPIDDVHPILNTGLCDQLAHTVPAWRTHRPHGGAFSRLVFPHGKFNGATIVHKVFTAWAKNCPAHGCFQALTVNFRFEAGFHGVQKFRMITPFSHTRTQSVRFISHSIGCSSLESTPSR